MFNFLNATGYGMHQQVEHFNNCTLYLCVLCLSENKQRIVPITFKKLIGFYNRYEKCLQRGTDWVFK
jgi:hypothetical protein